MRKVLLSLAVCGSTPLASTGMDVRANPAAFVALCVVGFFAGYGAAAWAEMRGW